MALPVEILISDRKDWGWSYISCFRINRPKDTWRLIFQSRAATLFYLGIFYLNPPLIHTPSNSLLRLNNGISNTLFLIDSSQTSLWFQCSKLNNFHFFGLFLFIIGGCLERGLEKASKGLSKLQSWKNVLIHMLDRKKCLLAQSLTLLI